MPQRDVGKDGVLGTVAVGEVTPNEEGPGDAKRPPCACGTASARAPGLWKETRKQRSPQRRRSGGDGASRKPRASALSHVGAGGLLDAQPRRRGSKARL